MFRFLWNYYPGWVFAIGAVAVTWIAFCGIAIFYMIKGL
jgi:hypothetical protein